MDSYLFRLNCCYLFDDRCYFTRCSPHFIQVYPRTSPSFTILSGPVAVDQWKQKSSDLLYTHWPNWTGSGFLDFEREYQSIFDNYVSTDYATNESVWLKGICFSLESLSTYYSEFMKSYFLETLSDDSAKQRSPISVKHRWDVDDWSF